MDTAAGTGVMFASKFGVGFSVSVRSGWSTEVPSVVRHPFHTNVHPSFHFEPSSVVSRATSPFGGGPSPTPGVLPTAGWAAASFAGAKW